MKRQPSYKGRAPVTTSAGSCVYPLYVCQECGKGQMWGGSPRYVEGKRLCPLCFLRLARVVW